MSTFQSCSLIRSGEFAGSPLFVVAWKISESPPFVFTWSVRPTTLIHMPQLRIGDQIIILSLIIFRVSSLHLQIPAVHPHSTSTMFKAPTQSLCQAKYPDVQSEWLILDYRFSEYNVCTVNRGNQLHIYTRVSNFPNYGIVNGHPSRTPRPPSQTTIPNKHESCPSVHI